MYIHKFGGTSVGGAERFRAAADLVLAPSQPAVVVVSAMAGVTDTLSELGRAAERRDTARVETLLYDLRTKHMTAADAVTEPGPRREELISRVRALLLELEQLLQGVRLLRELTPRSTALILSFGERLSSSLLAHAIELRGHRARAVDAREFIGTDAHFLDARVDLETSRKHTRKALLPLVLDEIPVVTGFIGRSQEGWTTTLGRGGSDYTASLLGSFMDADQIWIWTDVDGVMTADPRIVPEARVLDAISYREAAEMAYFGSKVLHPSTMIPAIGANIPIRIRNSFNPDHPGTWIRASEDGIDAKSTSEIPPRIGGSGGPTEKPIAEGLTTRARGARSRP